MKASPLKLISRVRRSQWTLPVAALAALVICGINEAAYDRSTTALAHLGERGQARSQIQLLWRALINAETGQRGYLLTGREEHLQPYQRAASDVQDSLRWLANYYSGDPQAAPLLADIGSYSASKLSEVATTIDLYRAGRQQAWRELVLTDIGREKMEGLRDAAERLLVLESERVRTERRDVVATLSDGRLGVNAMTALSLLALLVFLRQTLAFDRAQREHADDLQAERDRLQHEVARRTADLTALARHLETAREAERSRLARELHDELGALLTAAKLDAARLKRLIGVLAPDVEARLKHLNDAINRAIELKRRFIEELRPSSLSNLGLVAALEILGHDHAARSADVEVDLALEPVALSDSAQITAYRMVQEALTNASRHGSPSTITVTLQPQQRGGMEGARIAVADDGVGFDPRLQRGTTHGLLGLRYRVEAEGGALRVASQPGEGTELEAWLPRGEAEMPVTETLVG